MTYQPNQKWIVSMLEFCLPEVLPWRCDFEQDVCGMVNQSRGQFNWTRLSGRTRTDHTGPDRAWRGEYYLYIETSNPRRNEDRAL